LSQMSSLRKARSVRDLAIVRLDARPMRDDEFDSSAAENQPGNRHSTLAMASAQSHQHNYQSSQQTEAPAKPIILRSGDGSLHNRYSSVDCLAGNRMLSVAQQQQPQQKQKSGKTPPPRPSQPPKILQQRQQQVVALYDLLEPPEPGILTMRRGDRIHVLRQEDDNWYFGRHSDTGATGLLPR
ncbi:hypothetical protein BOX15_Mlig008631g1, partial [Macrostomum lignano]